MPATTETVVEYVGAGKVFKVLAGAVLALFNVLANALLVWILVMLGLSQIPGTGITTSVLIGGKVLIGEPEKTSGKL
ncbi:hypothetical protein [Methylovulum miyakonense]|uniref:hypothetical protein n=1 Tax=Methylovulum miyakonense TaxID=645578 RepID=UPI000365F822|nr:hypothetical protein [Methylovulum miyakonense]